MPHRRHSTQQLLLQASKSDKLMRQTSHQGSCADTFSMYTLRQGRLSPLTPWSKFPPPLPLSPPFPSPPLPSPPLRSRLGERFSSPSGSGRSPAAKRYLVNFRLKISPLATIFRSFSGNETSNYDCRVLPVHYQMCQYIRFLICREINHSVFAET